MKLTTRQRALLVDAIVISVFALAALGAWQVLVLFCRLVVWLV